MMDPQTAILIQQLGNDDFFQREQTSKTLIKMDERPIHLLRLIGENSNDLEIVRRSQRIIKIYENTIQPSKYNKMPWIDHLPNEFPKKSKITWEYMDPYKNHHQYDPSGDYECFRFATSDFIIDYLRKGHNRKQCIDLLDKMSESEKKWTKSQQKGFYKALPLGLEP